MRLLLTLFLIQLVFTAEVVPSPGAHPMTAKGRKACCGTSDNTSGCGGKGRPMPCCKIQPAPAPMADVPPSSTRAEAPAQAHLDYSSPSPSSEIAQPSGLVSARAHDLVPMSDPPKLYSLYASYLI